MNIESSRRTPLVQAGRPRGPLILAEELFRDVLIKERKRADRSNHSVVLVLITLNDGLGDNSAATWASVIEVLADVARDTDILGWFEWRAAIGLIMPELNSFTPAQARELEARISGDLARGSDVESDGRISIGFHVYPDAKVAEQADSSLVRPLDFPELAARQPGAIFHQVLKRLFDIVGSSALLMILAPVFLIIAVLAKVKSCGPVFYGQVRVGQRMKPFTMLKFRTMDVNADTRLHQEYMRRFINNTPDIDQSKEGGADKLFKIVNDPRVTPVGHFLRKTSLDELPQLWNVLRGDMSLVGPRPAIAYELEQYKPWHYRRVFDAKPGITGLWQVTGRSRTTFDQMVRLDLRYARTCSVWTDLRILLATPRAVISGKGAC